MYSRRTHRVFSRFSSRSGSVSRVIRPLQAILEQGFYYPGPVAWRIDSLGFSRLPVFVHFGILSQAPWHLRLTRSGGGDLYVYFFLARFLQLRERNLRDFYPCAVSLRWTLIDPMISMEEFVQWLADFLLWNKPRVESVCSKVALS